MVELLKGSLREANADRQRLLDENARLNTQPPKRELSPEEARQAYFENPREMIRGLLREELHETIAPLQEYVGQLKGQSALDKAVDALRRNPKIGPAFDDFIENIVRDAAASLPPAQITEQNLGNIAIYNIGLRATGMLPNAPAPTTQNEPIREERQSMPNPPYLRPSAPPAPRNNSNQPQIVLNENEQRLLRETNAKRRSAGKKEITATEWKQWENLPAADVATTNLSK
jgi:hypothetical protein